MVVLDDSTNPSIIRSREDKRRNHLFADGLFATASRSCRPSLTRPLVFAPDDPYSIAISGFLSTEVSPQKGLDYAIGWECPK